MGKAKAKPKTTKVRLSDDEFVEAYVKADSVDEVIESTGMTYGSISQKAKKLRDLGVDLPKFKRQAKEVDVVGLNRLIKSLKKK